MEGRNFCRINRVMRLAEASCSLRGEFPRVRNVARAKRRTWSASSGGQFTSMADVSLPRRTALRLQNGCHGHCPAGQRRELDLVGGCVLMNMDNRSHVPRLQALVREIGGQDYAVVLFDHKASKGENVRPTYSNPSNEQNSLARSTFVRTDLRSDSILASS